MSETEKYGVKELEELMLFGLTLAKEGSKALDNGAQLEDVLAVLPALKLAPEAFAGIDQVRKELSDLSDEEVAHLVAKVQALFKDMPAEKARKVALKGLHFGLVGIQLFNEVRAPAA